jgi:hypothetical protein
VLGAVLLLLVVVLYSCLGQRNSGAVSPKTSGSPSASAGPEATDPGLLPGTDAPTVDPSTGGDPSTGTGTGTGDTGGGSTDPAPVPEPAAPDPNTCTDDEMSVVPVPSQTPVKRGVTIELRLKIKNVSDRTCNRDVGADAQELYIKLGAQTVWSSDTCGTAKGSDIRSFPPALEHEYQVAWNGRESAKCANGVAAGDVPKAGDYQLFARLGGKRSDPVKLTITD